MACDITYLHHSIAKLAYFQMIRDLKQRERVPPVNTGMPSAQVIAMPPQTADESNEDGSEAHANLDYRHQQR